MPWRRTMGGGVDVGVGTLDLDGTSKRLDTIWEW